MVKRRVALDGSTSRDRSSHYSSTAFDSRVEILEPKRKSPRVNRSRVTGRAISGIFIDTARRVYVCTLVRPFSRAVSDARPNARHIRPIENRFFKRPIGRDEEEEGQRSWTFARRIVVVRAQSRLEIR